MLSKHQKSSLTQRKKSYKIWQARCLEYGVELLTPLECYVPKGDLKIKCIDFGHVTVYKVDTISVRIKKEIAICPICAQNNRLPRKNKPTKFTPERLEERRVEYDLFCKALQDRGWKMLSPYEDYKRKHTPMNVLCPELHEMTKKYKPFVLCEANCRICMGIGVPGFTPEYVRKYISDRGATWTGPDSEFRVGRDNLHITCKCRSPTYQSFFNFKLSDGNCWNCGAEERRARLRAMVKKCAQKKTLQLGDRTVELQGYEDRCIIDLLYGTYGEKIDPCEIRAGTKEMPRVAYTWEGSSWNYRADIFLPGVGCKGKLIEVKCQYWFDRQLERNLCMYEAAVAEGYEFEVWFYDKTKSNGRVKLLTILLERNSFVYVTESEDRKIKHPNLPPKPTI